MNPEIRAGIVRNLSANRIMSIATVRPDGWPQSTTVGYVHDGLELYFLCGRDSQKARNLAADNRISLTIGQDSPSPFLIQGLSMAAHAHRVDDPAAIAGIIRLMLKAYPEYAVLPEEDVAQALFFRVMPIVISLLDYRKGFGHTDLVEVAPEDMD